ncbi:MAG: hypothetical protein ACRDHZ_18530 [Ktedonobacteraceae bacterium]
MLKIVATFCIGIFAIFGLIVFVELMLVGVDDRPHNTLDADKLGAMQELSALAREYVQDHGSLFPLSDCEPAMNTPLSTYVPSNVRVYDTYKIGVSPSRDRYVIVGSGFLYPPSPPLESARGVVFGCDCNGSDTFCMMEAANAQPQ